VKSVYIVTMDSPLHPEHPVGEVYKHAIAAHRYSNQCTWLSRVIGVEFTLRVYRVDLAWWEDQHPVRMYVWKKVRRGGKRVRVINTSFSVPHMDRAYVRAW
jgi:hypothetical protein